ncbi:MAG TPA: hypothetical protein PKE58_20180, partial [Acidobacteriota bacterium]|nr:hypothetical protein [Acidobacteriota bacterium]
ESSRWSRGFGRYHRITAPPRFAPGWALQVLSAFSLAGFRSWPTILVPAPIRARIIRDLHSGGCASKPAAHRLLSAAHPGENRFDSIKEPNSIPH